MTALEGGPAAGTLAPADQDISIDAARPWLLGLLGGAAGLIIHILLEGPGSDTGWRVAGASFVFFGAIALGLTLSLRRPLEAAIFSGVLGLTMGGIAWHLMSAGRSVAQPEYVFAAGVFASLLAVPLFEAGFHRHWLATPYARAHAHAWTDVISGAGAALFTLVAWLLLWLVDALLSLVDITLVGNLTGEGWFGAAYTGAAFGTSLGVLRNNLGAIGALQNVVMLVLSLLALPFAAALLIFLFALLLTGGDALWQATDSATPILLACAAGAFLLANSVVRDDEATTSRNRAMLAAAAVLALGILPLASFSALSMGMRIGQYGLAPERLWALVAIGVALAFGLAYWVAAVRGRLAAWRDRLRDANLRLAAGVALLALILALPLFDFGAISAKNQLARLQAGKVGADTFDYYALKWEFGAAGREALTTLTRGEGPLARGEGEASRLAAQALRQDERWPEPGPPVDFAETLRVEPENPQVRALVTRYLESQSWRCRTICVALDLGPGSVDGSRDVVLVEQGGYEPLTLPLAMRSGLQRSAVRPFPPPLDGNSKVEVRELTRRYVTIDGLPLGPPLD